MCRGLRLGLYLLGSGILLLDCWMWRWRGGGEELVWICRNKIGVNTRADLTNYYLLWSLVQCRSGCFFVVTFGELIFSFFVIYK